MPAKCIRPGIYWIGVNDRTTDLFEGLWPIAQEGVSYNSYIILDQKKVLIELTKDHHLSSFVEQLHDLMDPADLDYIVLNHMEPDHTGVIRIIRQLAPKATFLCTAKAAAMLESFYGITDRVQIVTDGEELSLGEKTLQFFSVPFVHWPETMATYEKTEHVAFTCDAFGGYGALRGSIFDDECIDMDFYIRESLRYYVNIVARFSGPTLKAIAKLAGLEVEVIAPSHGLIWRKDPGRIVSLYKDWAEHATKPGEPGVTLIYGSMYGNTEVAMNAVAEGVARTGLPLSIYDAARTHASYILPSAWMHNGILVGAPTYEVSLFPPVAHVLETLVHKRIMRRKAAYFGSFGWSGGAQRGCRKLTEAAKWEWLEALGFVGAPSKDDLHEAERFGERFALALRET